MARYLREIDPFKHLVTNSLGSYVLEPKLWQLSEIDIVQIHGYFHPTIKDAFERGKDMAGFVTYWLKKIFEYKKPALFTEFGLVNESWGPSPYMEQDKEVIHFHNGLWASSLSGAAGSAHLWWWDNYIHPQNLYLHYKPLANLIAKIPWLTGQLKPLHFELERLRVFGLQGKDIVALWIQNKEFNWWNVVIDKKLPQVIEDERLRLTELEEGNYEIQWINTWKTEKPKVEGSTCPEGTLALKIPPLERDIACLVRRR